MMLQSSVELARSIESETRRDHAIVVAQKRYAAVNQYGGRAGRHSTVRIPTPPYLPVEASGALSSDARMTVMDIQRAAIKTLMSPGLTAERELRTGQGSRAGVHAQPRLGTSVNPVVATRIDKLGYGIGFRAMRMVMRHKACNRIRGISDMKVQH
jgi:hypothetical protein